MRVIRLIPLALLPMFATVPPCSAQTATSASAKPAPGASETVGVLSPNEQKRAERARARAASAAATGPAMATAAPKVDQPAAARHVAARVASPRRIFVADRPVHRRVWAASRDVDSRRTPRVGDVIPAGVPLSATPPTYPQPMYPAPYRQAVMVYPRGQWFYPAYRPLVRPDPPFPLADDD